jgi:hypothetical protein
MELRKIGLRWLASVALGTVAPLVFAQMGPPGGAMHEHGHNNPAWQDCKKQADDKKLAPGPERKQFMQQCLESKLGSSDAAKGEAARARMADPQSGHLHSDPPAAPPPAGN